MENGITSEMIKRAEKGLITAMTDEETSNECHTTGYQLSEYSEQSLYINIKSLKWSLIILCGGFFVSFICLIVEICWFKNT